jgi:L-ascorbate metabolism protein UlaG (beta-lactamase superfamily)
LAQINKGVRMPSRLLSFVVVGLLAFAGTAYAQGKAELQWFSQAGFKLTTPGGKVIMIDPWIKGATKLPDEFKDLSKLGKVDLILVTHGHGDHLGDAMEIAKTNDVPMWAPAGLNQTLLTLGLMPAKLVPRMSKGGTIGPSRRRTERAPGPRPPSRRRTENVQGSTLNDRA